MTKRKISITLFIFLFLILLLPNQEKVSAITNETDIIDSGSCGNNVHWLLDESGVLTVSGIGEVINYNNSKQPWYCYKDFITSININEGITSIGDNAFRDFSQVKTIILPKSLHSIYGYAFRDIKSLESVVFQEGIKTIDDYIFYGCSSLHIISIPMSVERIGDMAFYDCNILRVNYAGSPGSWIGIEGRTGISKNAHITYAMDDDTNCREVASGSCGSNLKWKFLVNGKLIISGTGKMTDWEALEQVPWNEYRKKIVYAEIESGAISVGRMAFEGTDNLEKVAIGEGVVTIEDRAFAHCSKLWLISFPRSLKVIGWDAVSNGKNYINIEYAGYYDDWCEVRIYPGNTALERANYIFHQHNLVEDPVVKATFTKDGKTKGFHCSICNEVYTEQKRIPKVSHVYTIDCIFEYTYTGKPIKPGIIVTDERGKYLVEGTDYTLNYGANTKIGKGTVDINLLGNYEGRKTLEFDILPKKISGVVAKSNSYNSVKLSWTKGVCGVGYKVYRATSKTGFYSLVKTVGTNSTVSYVDTGLTCGKTYYYKIRAYRTVDGKKYYSSSYSTIVSVKPKPAKTTISSISNSAKKTVTLKWTKVSGASGYEIYRATSKTGSYTKAKTITSGATITYKNTSLTKGKTYYFKVRAYRTVSGKKVYGSYSEIKSIKIIK